MRTWDDWQPGEWPTERTERAWTPATPCPFQDRGLACPNGGVHRLASVWQDCFLQFIAAPQEVADATPPPADVAARADRPAAARPAGAPARESVHAGRARLARRAWTALRAFGRYALDAAGAILADQADPATYDPGPTYGWGPGHTGRGWRRWL
jgi:hypothetical protein